MLREPLQDSLTGRVVEVVEGAQLVAADGAIHSSQGSSHSAGHVGDIKGTYLGKTAGKVPYRIDCTSSESSQDVSARGGEAGGYIIEGRRVGDDAGKVG